MAVEFGYDDIIGIFALIGQIAAVWLAYCIYRHNRLNTSWLAIVLALGIMALRRITSLVLLLSSRGADYAALFRLLDKSILPAIVTVLFLIGMWGMKKSFDNFAVVEKDTRDKIGSMLLSKRK